MDLIKHQMPDAALTPALSLGRGSKALVLLLPGEKGLGDEGLQFNCASLLRESIELRSEGNTPHLMVNKVD
jgi:hypothetical protein